LVGPAASFGDVLSARVGEYLERLRETGSVVPYAPAHMPRDPEATKLRLRGDSEFEDPSPLKPPIRDEHSKPIRAQHRILRRQGG
jgi:hypothetical protein